MNHRRRRTCSGKPSSFILNLSELRQFIQSLQLSVNLSKNEWWGSTKALLPCSMKPTIENFTIFSLKVSLKRIYLPVFPLFINNSCSFPFKYLAGWMSSFMYGVKSCGRHSWPQRVKAQWPWAHSLCSGAWVHTLLAPHGLPAPYLVLPQFLMLCGCRFKRFLNLSPWVLLSSCLM